MELENQLLINEALSFLKKHYVLFANVQNIKTYFYYKNNFVRVVSANSSFNLSEDDFFSLYKDSKFYLIEDNNSVEIDVEKDKEYYSWKQ